MAEKQKTIANIIAEMRHGLDKSWHEIDREWARSLPDRLEAALKRKNIFAGEDSLHAAFVEHCNKCDCPMGCIHRQYMLPSAMLDTRCASILKCFARFVVNALKKGGAKRATKGKAACNS